MATEQPDRDGRFQVESDGLKTVLEQVKVSLIQSMSGLDLLSVKELSCSNCNGSVSRVNQVVDVLTVLVWQSVFAAPEADRTF